MIVGYFTFVFRGGIKEGGMAAIFTDEHSGLVARDRLVSLAST
jgi:hypothetical protein